MTTNQIQTEVFKRLLANERCHWCDIDDNTIAITFDGKRAFAVRKSELKFDLLKCHINETLKPFFELAETEQEITFTRETALSPDNRRIEQKGISKNFDIWVDRTFIKDLRYYKFFAGSSISAIKAVNQVTGKVEAIIMPLKRGGAHV